MSALSRFYWKGTVNMQEISLVGQFEFPQGRLTMIHRDSIGP
jgi:hypothetical protein